MQRPYYFEPDIYYYFTVFSIFAPPILLRGVIGNTSDSGSEKSRFEPWRSNHNAGSSAGIFILRSQGETRNPAVRDDAVPLQRKACPP